jgi:hypothetical protein
VLILHGPGVKNLANPERRARSATNHAERILIDRFLKSDEIAKTYWIRSIYTERRPCRTEDGYPDCCSDYIEKINKWQKENGCPWDIAVSYSFDDLGMEAIEAIWAHHGKTSTKMTDDYGMLSKHSEQHHNYLEKVVRSRAAPYAAWARLWYS